MTGIIFTGHGTFASGMHSAVSLLAGSSDHILFVDFPGDNVELLKKKLQSSISFLLEKQCSHILILCDILGGTPFNTSVALSLDFPNIHIVYGITVALAVEICLSSDDSDLSEADLVSLLADSREMTGLFQLSPESTREDSSEVHGYTDEGI